METLNKDICILFFELQRAGERRSVQVVADELGLSRRQAAESLAQLAEGGLLNLSTLSLTFVGLVRALSFQGSRLSSPCTDQLSIAEMDIMELEELLLQEGIEPDQLHGALIGEESQKEHQSAA